MTTGTKGIELIKEFEGCKLTAYKCAGGVWTIGYGHTSGVKEGQTITKAQAEAYLKSDLATFEKYVNSYVTVDITQEQFDALVSFCFNLGAGTLKKSAMLKYINAYNYAAAQGEFGKYVQASGKVLAGLVRRREAERVLFDEGCYNHYTRPTEPVTKESTKESIKWLQWALNVVIHKGVLTGADNKTITTPLTVDGIFGAKTAAAGLAYLKYRGWYTGKQTGYYIGTGTISALAKY